MGRRGAVATNHPVATQAGLDVLRAGGTAVDAAVAVSLTLGVVEPHMSGLGGDGFFNVHVAGAAGLLRQRDRRGAGGGDRRRGTVPRAASRWPGRSASRRRGCWPGWRCCMPRHGTLPWARLVAPAEAAARDGFAATHAYPAFRRRQPRRGCGRMPAARRASWPAGEAPALGALVVQPELAETLDEIARDGAEGFYRGALAKRLAAGIAAAGGLVAEADLAACTAEAAGADQRPLPRLRGAADPAEFHRLHLPADAADPRALRSRGAGLEQRRR